MVSALECAICLEPFGEHDNKPMMLPCGHSFCYKCLAQLVTKDQCPQCKQKVPGLDASKLPVNYTLLSVALELKPENLVASSRYWCCTCKLEATPSCGDAGHSLQGLRGMRRALTREELQALGRCNEALSKEIDVQSVVLEQLLVDSDRSRALHRRVVSCSGRLFDCVEPWQQLLEETDLLLQEGKYLEEDLQLLRCQESFSISSATWKAEELQLQKQPLLSLALLQLRRNGQLQQRKLTAVPAAEPSAALPARVAAVEVGSGAGRGRADRASELAAGGAACQGDRPPAAGAEVGTRAAPAGPATLPEAPGHAAGGGMAEPAAVASPLVLASRRRGRVMRVERWPGQDPPTSCPAAAQPPGLRVGRHCTTVTRGRGRGKSSVAEGAGPRRRGVASTAPEAPCLAASGAKRVRKA